MSAEGENATTIRLALSANPHRTVAFWAARTGPAPIGVGLVGRLLRTGYRERL